MYDIFEQSMFSRNRLYFYENENILSRYKVEYDFVG